MLSPQEERAARSRANAAAVAQAAVGLRHLAAGVMGSSRSRGQLDVAVAGLMEALSRSFREMPHEVATCALAVVRAVHDAQQPPVAPSRPIAGPWGDGPR